MAEKTSMDQAYTYCMEKVDGVICHNRIQLGAKLCYDCQKRSAAEIAASLSES